MKNAPAAFSGRGFFMPLQNDLYWIWKTCMMLVAASWIYIVIVVQPGKQKKQAAVMLIVYWPVWVSGNEKVEKHPIPFASKT